jgi:nucleotide-binding universal stress UspA family protein
MTYKTLLVHLEPGQGNGPLLSAAGQFAERFAAHVIGIAATQPMIVVAGDGLVCGDVYADDQRQATVDFGAAEAEFRQALQGRGAGLEWRSELTIVPPIAYLSAHARSADLIMTGSMSPGAFALSHAADPGSLVMEAGRPVFIVPSHARPLQWQGALIGWKDTRECRRATADALPLLKQTAHVTVLEIAAIDDLDAARVRVDDVVTWLARHGVTASARIEPSTGNDGQRLQAAADDANADVIVAGAYGHSRLREWVIGGVTRDLLLEGRRGVMVSH